MSTGKDKARKKVFHVVQLFGGPFYLLDGMLPDSDQFLLI